MKHFFFAVFLLSFVPQISKGQKPNLQDVKNVLLCNVYAYPHADRATSRFLRANFPYLDEPRPPGGWSMPPIGINSTKKIVSMKFQQHPFFQFDLKEGRVDFHEVISAGEKFETGADLWLIFANEKDANAAFKVLTDTLASVSNDKKITNESGQTTAFFSGAGNFRKVFTVNLILEKMETGDFAIYLPDNDRAFGK